MTNRGASDYRKVPSVQGLPGGVSCWQKAMMSCWVQTGSSGSAVEQREIPPSTGAPRSCRRRPRSPAAPESAIWPQSSCSGPARRHVGVGRRSDTGGLIHALFRVVDSTRIDADAGSSDRVRRSRQDLGGRRQPGQLDRPTPRSSDHRRLGGSVIRIRAPAVITKIDIISVFGPAAPGWDLGSQIFGKQL